MTRDSNSIGSVNITDSLGSSAVLCFYSYFENVKVYTFETVSLQKGKQDVTYKLQMCHDYSRNVNPAH